MTDAEVAVLEDAVRDGKNLIVFCRARGWPDFGQFSTTVRSGKNGLGLLPARPGTLYEGNRLENKFDAIGEFNVAHPLFKPFTGGE